MGIGRGGSLEDEIRTLAIRGERKGLVTRSMREMIAGVMNLDEGQVSQIMTPRAKSMRSISNGGGSA